ncbi:MAG: hypothetical protein RBS38_14010 [Bacteroidales bacterium]|jgi:predicted small lipoprotein YifL|nr:hypothetical protein [Bacteroidales bacterium]
MKKLFVFIMAAGFLFSLAASGQSSPWYQTADGQVTCKKVAVQGDKLKVVLENGEKQVVPAASVSSYYTEDKLFLKKGIFADGVMQEKFMEFLKTRDDMSLFMFPDNGTYRYLVYKGDELFIEILEGNRDEFMKFFALN